MFKHQILVNIPELKMLCNISNVGSLLSLPMKHENLPFHLVQKEYFHVCESNTYLHCILNCFLKLKIIIMYAAHVISVSVKHFLLVLC